MHSGTNLSLTESNVLKRKNFYFGQGEPVKILYARVYVGFSFRKAFKARTNNHPMNLEDP